MQGAPGKYMKLSVVMPARNEAPNVGPTLDTLVERLRAEDIDYEIVVVDDGSTDGTAAEVLARAARDASVRSMLCGR